MKRDAVVANVATTVAGEKAKIRSKVGKNYRKQLEQKLGRK